MVWILAYLAPVLNNLSTVHAKLKLSNKHAFGRKYTTILLQGKKYELQIPVYMIVYIAKLGKLDWYVYTKIITVFIQSQRFLN